MPITLRDLVTDRTLGLRSVCPSADLDREVGWVHSSELPDPAPYLDGGELLLTTGLGPDAAGPARYVAGLARHGLVGLGFGTGLGHDAIPDEVVRACAGHGLALLEIPERTPFIAITKAVSASLAADSYAQVVRTDEAQRALTAAALGRSGTSRVLRGLAGRLGAWVLVSDADGAVRHAAPRTAGRRAEALLPEIDRVRAHRNPTSVTVAVNGGQVVLQPIRLPGSGAVLVVGRDRAFSPVDRQVIGSAVSVLTLLHSRTSAVGRAERRLRTALLRLMVDGPAQEAREIAGELWGPLPGAGARVVVLRRRSGSTRELLDVLESVAARSGPLFFGALDDVVVAVVAADAGEPVTALAGPRPDVRAGVSDPVDDIGVGLRQARQALDAGAHRGNRLVRFGELAGEGLRSLVPDADAAAFAESLLRPLVTHDAHGRGDLVRSLREWLAHHGQWDPAATRLGVHRHTLRARMDRVASLLGRDLDSPGVRSELWFALQVDAT
ncbi:purine catabolism regulator [Pseudonocardia sediminis]|uniref:Purine catabolism regulator n=1 Tax=Pseudonocardia sediminis TaxID=1397368 RepID=A0A4Q7V1K9_PSEST|nr:PucR family transcriptional regulator [Pseudonocardia sediminis]RZT86449.1 purine catabolism regulator [Pseudonocardia sediminis]